jgi:hypothetical protein
VLIGGAAPSSQQTSVQWTPIDGLHSRTVLTELGQRVGFFVVTDLPNHQLVIVAT